MRQFTGTQKQQHAAIVTQLEAAKAALELAVTAINEQLVEDFAAVELAIAKFNEDAANAFAAVEVARDAYTDALGAAAAFVEDVRSDAQSYFDDRSEKWQEGEAGEAYQEWLDELDAVHLDAAEIDEPAEVELPDRPEIEMPEFDALDTFEGMRQGVDE